MWVGVVVAKQRFAANTRSLKRRWKSTREFVKSVKELMASFLNAV